MKSTGRILIGLIAIAVPVLLSFTADSPMWKERGIRLIGMHHLGQHGLLFIEKGEDGGHVGLRRIGTEGSTLWATQLAVPSLRGYSFSKVQILHNEHFIYWINQTDNSRSMDLMDMRTGRLLKKDIVLENGLRVEDPVVPCGMGKEHPVQARVSDGRIELSQLDSTGATPFETLFTVKPEHGGSSLSIARIEAGSVIASSYNMSRDHRKMQLFLFKANIETGDTTQFQTELELDQVSFTYNSMVDQALFSVIPSRSGFYLMGKLDHGFAKVYPNTKLTEAFIGVWLAKFTPSMEMEYFRQIPFQHFQGMVTNDVVTKAAVLSVYEDANRSILINIHETKEIFYGHKYVITLDTSGIQRAITGGKDAHHFFEYDARGLHDASRSNHVRIMNDHWSYYPTANLHLIQYIEDLHSEQIGIIQRKAEDLYMEGGELIYQVTTLGKRRVLLEYVDRRGGQLSIYPF